MPNVENMETGSLLIATRAARNNLSAKSCRKSQSEEQTPDFLTDILSKQPGFYKKGSVIKQGNSGEEDGLGVESQKLKSTEPVVQSGPLENKECVDQDSSFESEAICLKDQMKESGDEEKENKIVQSSSFPPLEFLFFGKKDFQNEMVIKTEDVNSSLDNIYLSPEKSGLRQPNGGPVDKSSIGGQGSGEGSPELTDPKGEIKIEKQGDLGIFLQGVDPDSLLSKASRISGGKSGGQGSGEGIPGSTDPKGEILKERPNNTGIFLKEAVPDFSLSKTSLFSGGEDFDIKSDQSPVEGAKIGGQLSGEGISVSMDSTGESPVKRPALQGTLDLKDGLKSGPDANFLLDKIKTFVERISQSPAEEPALNIDGSEREKSDSKKSIKPPSGKDKLQKEGIAGEVRIPLAQDRQSSNSMMIEKSKWVPSETGKDGQPGESPLIKEGIIEDPKGIFAPKDRLGSETILESKGLNNNEIAQTGENQPGNSSRQTPLQPIVSNDSIHGESVFTEKSINNKQDRLNHFSKTYELDFLKDHHFSIKNQTSSSMEISLEPAGLGKLDIELNLNQDRLQGQIMVNDKAGKELIEQNLPQLLSDLAREGLQIGGFTVSLKHQGRGQNPVLPRTDFEDPSLKPVSPEKVILIPGNHLIHIIV